MPNPNKTETDLSAEHRREKDQRATRWMRYGAQSREAVLPEDLSDGFDNWDAERIARGMLSARGQ